MEKQAVNLTEGPILPGLFRLFLPIMLGALLQQCYNTVDAAIVSNCLGKESLAAVGGTSSTMINLVMEFLVGISSGCAVVISQHFGAGRKRAVLKSVRTALGIGAALGLTLTAAGILAVPTLLRWLHAPEAIAGIARVYLRTYFSGLMAMSLYNTGAAVLRAVGDSREPLYILAGCCVLNLVLDLLLVAALGWGIFGAALATVASQAVSAALVLHLLRRRFSQAREEAAEAPAAGERDIARRMLALGFPSGLQAVMYAVSNMAVQSRVNTFSTDFIAASSAFDRLEAFYWMVLNAFGVAVLTFMGQNYGAENGPRMRRGVRVCLLSGTVLAVLLSGASMAGGRWFFRLFTRDAAVRDMGLSILYFMMPWYFIYVFIEVFSAVIRSTGDALRPMVICCFGICALRLVWSLWISPAVQDFRFLLLGYPISWSVTSLLFVLYYRFGGPMRRLVSLRPEG